MYSDSKYRWVVVCPIALFSLLTFCAAISEAAIAKNADNPSYFPTGVPGAGEYLGIASKRSVSSTPDSCLRCVKVPAQNWN